MGRAGCQKLHVIADNRQLLILTAPKAPAGPGLAHCAEGARRRRRSAQMVAVPVHMVAVPWGKRPFFLRGAFGARLRRGPSALAFGHH